MYNLELFVITVYCLIADELYPDFCQKYGNPRRAGFSPDLKDRELFVRQSAYLWQVKAVLHQQLVKRLEGHHAPLLKAYGHDSKCRDELLDRVAPHNFVLGDTAFLDLDWQQQVIKPCDINLLSYSSESARLS